MLKLYLCTYVFSKFMVTNVMQLFECYSKVKKFQIFNWWHASVGDGVDVSLRSLQRVRLVLNQAIRSSVL